MEARSVNKQYDNSINIEFFSIDCFKEGEELDKEFEKAYELYKVAKNL